MNDKVRRVLNSKIMKEITKGFVSNESYVELEIVDYKNLIWLKVDIIDRETKKAKDLMGSILFQDTLEEIDFEIEKIGDLNWQPLADITIGLNYREPLAVTKIMYEGQATIVFFNDKTKSVVKHNGEGEYDKTLAASMAIAKRVAGSWTGLKELVEAGEDNPILSVIRDYKEKRINETSDKDDRIFLNQKKEDLEEIKAFINSPSFKKELKEMYTRNKHLNPTKEVMVEVFQSKDVYRAIVSLGIHHGRREAKEDICIEKESMEVCNLSHYRFLRWKLLMGFTTNIDEEGDIKVA